MKILITGGHLTPALALIEKLPKDATVLYCGRKYALEGDSAYSLEYQTIMERNIPFAEISTGRLQRHFTKYTIPSLSKIPYGLYSAFKIVKKFNPDVVLGFGGYVSVPLCVAARLLHKPVIIHEQTLGAGLANKMLAFFADKICVSWESSLNFFPKEKSILTGNPAVSGIFTDLIKDSGKNTTPTIVIVGGSLGSHKINTLVKDSLDKLLEDFNVFHQTGDAKQFNDYELLTKKRELLPNTKKTKYALIKFIDPKDIVKVFSKADLVVTRAGINTITTLLILNKPSLIVPLGISQNSEQKTNALFFKKHGLGEMVYQKDLTPEKFSTIIHVMMKNRAKYANTYDKSELMLHKDAAQRIIEIVYAQKNNFKKKNQAKTK